MGWLGKSLCVAADVKKKATGGNKIFRTSKLKSFLDTMSLENCSGKRIF